MNTLLQNCLILNGLGKEGEELKKVGVAVIFMNNLIEKMQKEMNIYIDGRICHENLAETVLNEVLLLEVFGWKRNKVNQKLLFWINMGDCLFLTLLSIYYIIMFLSYMTCNKVIYRYKIFKPDQLSS